MFNPKEELKKLLEKYPDPQIDHGERKHDIWDADKREYVEVGEVE